MQLNVTLILAAAMVLGGCAKSTTPTPPTPLPSQIITDVQLALAAGEALVSALPSIPANVKAEVQAGAALLNTGLSCTNSAIASGATGTQLGLTVAGCFTSFQIGAYSAQAQQYLSALNDAVQVLLTYFAGPAPTVTAADRAQVPALQARTKAISKAVR